MKNRKVIKEMQQRGWDHAITGKCHLKFTFRESGYSIYYSGTPSDHRAHKNMIALARRVERGQVGACAPA